MKNKKKLWIICTVIAAVPAVTVSATLVAAGQWNRAETQPLSDGETDPVILLDDITPPELTEAATTTVPPTSTGKPTDAAPSGDTAKPASAERQNETAEPVTPPATRQITVDGKKLTLQYVNHREARGAQSHDGEVYRAANGVMATFDSITGEWLTYDVPYGVLEKERSKKNEISSEQAQKIAVQLIKDAGYDISGLSLDVLRYVDYNNYYIVSYSLPIDGIRSSELYEATVFGDGTICSLYCNPHIFDQLDISRIHINEEKLTEQLMKDVSSDNIEKIEKEVIIDQDGKLQLQFTVFYSVKPGMKGKAQIKCYPIEY